MTVAPAAVAPLGVPDPWAASPLALLLRDERTHALLARLAAQLEALRVATEAGLELPTLVIRSADVAYARRQWERAIRQGEHRLYDLGTLMAWELLGTRRLQHVARVVASPAHERSDHRIVIEEPISPEELRRRSDHSLAAAVVGRYRWRGPGEKTLGRLHARASFLELRPLEAAPGALATRVLTRVKVEDQIWNKVCDAFFDIDAVVQRDKILNLSSKYIKDVFGIKVLTTQRDHSYLVAERLAAMRVDAADLDRRGGGPARLELIESKDYLALPPDKRKQTGWEALKNVYRWEGQVFETQIQTEANYFLEAWDLSKTSHRTFEMQRRALRARLEERVPHYREFRALLRALFTRTAARDGAALPAWLKVEP